MKKRQLKIIYFLVLGLFLLETLFFIYLSSGEPVLQFKIGFLASVFYLLLSLLYHYLDGSLKTRIVLEYILVSLLAVVILRGVFL